MDDDADSDATAVWAASPWTPVDPDAARTENIAATYGELTERGAQQLLDYFQPTDSDVFCDIGSGNGGLVLQVATMASLKRCIGVEFIKSRHDCATGTLEVATILDTLETRDVTLIYGDALDQNYDEVTLAFLCSTCFPPDFLSEIATRLEVRRKTMTLVTLMRFPDPHPQFLEIDEIALDTTWARDVPGYVYLVLPE